MCFCSGRIRTVVATCMATNIFSSPEPLGSQGELIVYPSSRRPSVRRPSASVVHHFQRSSPLKPLGQSKPNFMWSLLWEGVTKDCINGPCHMTKMAATPIYGKKPFKNLLLQNRRADFHETCYVALGTPAHHSLFK